MGFSTREYASDDAIIQNANTLTENLGTEGDILYAETLDKQLTVTGGRAKAISKVLGEVTRRKGSEKVQGPDKTLTGTYSTIGTAITGVGTAFLTELAQGDFLLGPGGVYREIESITNNTSATLLEAFGSNVPAGQAVVRQQTVSERIRGIDYLPVNSPTIGQSPRASGSGVSEWVDDVDLLPKFTVRSGKVVAIGDVVSHYANQDTVEKNGSQFKLQNIEELVPAAGGITFKNAHRITDSIFVITYVRTDFLGVLVTLDNDGVATVSSPVTIGTAASAGNPVSVGCVTMDSSVFVLTFTSTTIGAFIRSVVCTIAAGTFTVGANSDVAATSATVNVIHTSRIDGSRFALLAISAAASPYTCRIFVCSVAATVTYGSPTTFSGTYATITQGHVLAVSPTNVDTACVILLDGTTSHFYYVTFSGTGITVEDNTKANAAGITITGATANTKSSYSISNDGLFVWIYYAASNGTTPYQIVGYKIASRGSGSASMGEIPVIINQAITDDGGLPFSVTNAANNNLIQMADDIIISGGSSSGIVVSNILMPIKINYSDSYIGIGSHLNGSIFINNSRKVTLDPQVSPTSFSVGTIVKLNDNRCVYISIRNDAGSISFLVYIFERHRVLGIAHDAGDGNDPDPGNKIRVQIFGINSDVSALSSGNDYYTDESGNLSLVPELSKIGRAITASKLLLDVSEVS